MNIIKKLLASLTALVMAVGFMIGGSLPVMAAGNGTITVKPPTGTQNDTSNTYRLYKVFDATVDETTNAISYKLTSSKTDVPTDASYGEDYTGAKFVKDDSGNIYLGTLSDTTSTGAIEITVNKAKKYLIPQPNTQELNSNQIAAIKAYVNADTTEDNSSYVTSQTSKGTAAATFSNLDYGYYYVSTTTGSLVTITSTAPTASVNDKNSVPQVSKTIINAGSAGSISTDGKKAIVELGQTITYQVKVTFGKGTKKVWFHDKMGTGLAKIENSDVTVVIKDSDSETATDITSTYQPTVLRGDQTETSNNVKDDLTIKFADGTPENAVATITYTAKVTSGDLNINSPAENKAWVTYGDSDGKTPEDKTQVYNARFAITKHNQNGGNLPGAGFVIKQSDGKYYHLDETTNTVTWVDNIDDATEHTSNENGVVPEFKGLPAATYSVVEKTVPQGYNKAADYSFTVNAANTTDGLTEANLDQSTIITNRAGSVLPSTGGIGTTIFYVAGGILIIGAAVLLIARRKRNA